jgi:outer membrane protein OmpA-like peptidoglycan-associated protein
MQKNSRWVLILILLSACAKPMFVSHLSPQGLAFIKKKGWGRPVHHWYSAVICFDQGCRTKAAWRKSQKEHRYNGFKDIEPALKNEKSQPFKIDTAVFAVKPKPSIKPTLQKAEVQQRRDTVIVLSGEVFFEYNSSVLKRELQAKLDTISQILMKYPQFKATISGHTDNTGNETYNLKLSEKRAENVASYLIDAGIAPDRVTFVGYGSYLPVGDNSTEAGRRKNRRVEIRLQRK